MDPKIFIIWTCAIIFALTGVITLLALTKIITIETRFLNKLFVTLILEVVAVSIGFIYTGYGKGDNDKEIPRSVLVRSKIDLIDSNQSMITNISEPDFRKGLEIKTIPDYNVKSLNGITFMVYGKDLPQITYSYPGFESQIIDLSKYPDSLKNNKIDLGTIKLKKVNQSYDPPPVVIPEITNGPPISRSDEGSM